MKVAVIGGGIFGITAALALRKKGHEVHLYEKQDDILQAASGINQCRLHRGYHYPRSPETILSSIASEISFRKEYQNALCDKVDHYYAVSNEKSHLSGKEYLEICDEYGLEYFIVNTDIVDSQTTDVCIKVNEAIIDPFKLKEICKEKLKEHSVQIFLSTEVTKKDLEIYDYTVICAYAAQNDLIDTKEKAYRNYQFEICEKPIAKLPKEYQGKSIVIMDGPFMCIDPYGSTGFHVMGNVVHAIHASNIGPHPIIPDDIKPLLHKGIIENCSLSRFREFIKTASEFMPRIQEAEYIGSQFVIRAVLPHQEKTDTRPTLVEKINEKTISVFSGKLSNCVEAANKVLEYIENP